MTQYICKYIYQPISNKIRTKKKIRMEEEPDGMTKDECKMEHMK